MNILLSFLFFYLAFSRMEFQFFEDYNKFLPITIRLRNYYWGVFQFFVLKFFSLKQLADFITRMFRIISHFIAFPARMLQKFLKRF